MSIIKSIASYQTFGDDVLDRLTPTPPRLKPFVKRFGDTHKKYSIAAKAAADARAARDEALAKVAQADRAQDAAVDALADDLVGAALGKRSNPFAAFGKASPAALKALAYKLEAAEIGALAAAISKGAPPAKVKATVVKCQKAAGAVLTAIAAVTKPQLAFDKARATRDGLLAEWTLELHRLQREAAAYFGDDTASYRATFAPPEKIAAPKKKRRPRAGNGAAKTPTAPTA